MNNLPVVKKFVMQKSNHYKNIYDVFDFIPAVSLKDPSVKIVAIIKELQNEN